MKLLKKWGCLTTHNLDDKQGCLSHQVIDLSVGQSSLIDKKSVDFEMLDSPILCDYLKIL